MHTNFQIALYLTPEVAGMAALYKDPNVGGLIEVEPSQEEKP